ncbi:MAG: peroxiredoxin [Planctomycetota bacterium]
MLAQRSPVPDFTLPDHTGTGVTLASLLERGPLVLYFYPADFTPLCTAEACSFRDTFADPDLESAGLSLAGVSPQSVESHRKFREKFSLNFPLLSDPDKTVIKAYEAAMPFGLGTRRVTYLIDIDKTIIDAVEANFGLSKHNAFIERAIAQARSHPSASS